MPNNLITDIYEQTFIIDEVKTLYQEALEDSDKEYMSLENESYHMIYNLYNLMHNYKLSEKKRDEWKTQNTEETKYLLKLTLAYKKLRINYFYSVILNNEKKKQNIKISTFLKKHLNYIESEAKSKGLKIPSNISTQYQPKQTTEKILTFLKEVEKDLYYAEYKYEKKIDPESTNALLPELCLRTFYPEVLKNDTLPTNYDLMSKYSIMFDTLNYAVIERYFSKTQTVVSEDLIVNILKLVPDNNIKEIKEIEASAGVLTFWLHRYKTQREYENLKITAVDGKENQVEIPGYITSLEKHTDVKKIISPKTDTGKTLYLFNNIKEDRTQHMLDILNEIPINELIGSISKKGLSFCERSNPTDYGILYSSDNNRKIKAKSIFSTLQQPTEFNVYEKQNNIEEHERDMLKEAVKTELYYRGNYLMKLDIIKNIYKDIINIATEIKNDTVLSYIYSKQNDVFPDTYKYGENFLESLTQLVNHYNIRIENFKIDYFLNHLSHILINALALHHKDIEKPNIASVASLVTYKDTIEIKSTLLKGEYEKTKSYYKKIDMTK